MWVIVAVSLLISLALFVRGWLDKTRVIDWRFFILGLVVISVAPVLTLENDYLHDALSLSSGLLFATSFLIALPILRRRVIPPCVRVKRSVKYWIFFIIVFFFGIAFIIYISVAWGLRSLGMTILYGCLIVPMVTYFFLGLFEKVEICGNGLWQSDGLWPWGEYNSFSWGKNTADSVELKLVLKQRIFFRISIRLMVPFEDREAVRQILEPNLPEQPIIIDT